MSPRSSYRIEKEEDIYSDGYGSFSDDYVWWLESKFKELSSNVSTTPCDTNNYMNCEHWGNQENGCMGCTNQFKHYGGS